MMEIHASMGWLVFLSISVLVLSTRGQQIPSQNVISDTIPYNLRDCYNGTFIVVKDNLLPMTMTNFIALLRKLEDATYSMNSRLLAPSILLKYRYDGIQRDPAVQATDYVKPYSRSGNEHFLYKLQMNRIIPSTSSISSIPDGTLTWIEKCTLHSMLSLSIDKYDRGDGDTPCSKLSKYSEWNARYPRDLSKMGDAEFLWPNYDQHMSGDYQFAAGSGYQTATSQCPVENGVVYDKYGSVAPGIVLGGLAAGLNYQAVPYNSYFVQPRAAQGQRRPVQSAIDHYRNLFSSYQQQNGGGRVPPGGGYGQPGGQGNGGSHGQPNLPGYPRPGGNNYDSLGQGNGYGQGIGYPQSGGYGPTGQGSGSYRPSSNPGYGNGGSNVGSGYGTNGNGYGTNGGSSYGGGQAYGTNSYGEVDIDSRYAATLSGVIALEALVQGPTTSINVGNRGGWNSSSVPKYYFLQNPTNINTLTDARIVGAVDGLYLATNIQSWISSAGDIKLSQLFDAYYSDKGVLSTQVKACNRKANFPSFSTQLNQQSYAVSYMLNNDLPPNSIIKTEGVQYFADYTTTQTSSYIPSLPGTQCPENNSSAPYSLPNADLTVVVDCSWTYSYVAGIFNYLAEECNLWKYGSNLTIINGKDGTVLAESIQSPLDIPQDYNQTVVSGFDFPKVLSQLKVRFQNKLENSVTTQSAGGLPHVVIFVPMASTMSDKDKSNAQDTINYFQHNIPDVRFLYLVAGTKEAWTPFAYNDKDVFVSNKDSDLAISLKPLVSRIATIPRRLINPSCGRYFNGGSYSRASLDGYVSPNEINYYRIHQNYLFGDSKAIVTISKGYNTPTLMVCQSRKNGLPTRNISGSGDVNCQQLTSSNTIQFTLDNACDGDYYASSCNPFYFSIYNTQTSSSTTSNGISCKDAQCRFLDQAKYTITHQGLVCHSSAITTIFSSSLLISVLMVQFIFRS